MDYIQAKKIAIKLARQYTLKIDFDDRVQECLICWLELRHRDVPNKYIYASMRNRMIDIWREEQYKSLILVEDIDAISADQENPLQFLERKESLKVIAVPYRTRVVRAFVSRMLDNNLNLEKSCRDVGISYTRGASWWRRGKELVRKLIEENSWKPEDVISVANL